MSIVICAVINNETMFIGADCRAINTKGINDNFRKFFQIRPFCYYAITGIAEDGLWFLEKVKKKGHLTIKKLIEWTDKNFEMHNFTLLTVTLTGKDEDGNFFIWQKNQEGETTFPTIVPKGCTFSISSNDNISLFTNYFKEQLKVNQTLMDSISKTILYASTIDHSISEKHEIACLT